MLRSKAGLGFFLIRDKLLVMSLFLMDQFVFSFFIFRPAASAILDKLELEILAGAELK